jgi:apolipoprotein D and lipocalin family protein
MPAGDQALLPAAEIWVLWMDFDDRTAAIGTPSGRFGWIMDKNTTGGGDRITAARDIMEWFGYNMAQLEEVRR